MYSLPSPQIRDTLEVTGTEGREIPPAPPASKAGESWRENKGGRKRFRGKLRKSFAFHFKKRRRPPLRERREEASWSPDGATRPHM